MIVSLANSIRFKADNDLYPNFDNTLVADEDFINQMTYDYCQVFLSTDTVKVQVKADVGETPVFTIYRNDGNSYVITESTRNSYGNFDFIEYEIDMLSHLNNKMYAEIVGDTDTFNSEPWKVVSELNSYYYKVEWFNNNDVNNNAFEMDWSTGVTGLMYVEAIQKDYEPSGESSVYDNQGEKVKLKEIVVRGLNLQVSSIPRWVFESLKIASACDAFYVNDVEYVREEEPDYEPLDGSNLVETTLNLTQVNVLGLNTYDVGYDCDTVVTDTQVINKQILGASGQNQLIIEEGYLLHTTTLYYQAGANVVVIADWTVGGSDLIYGVELDSGNSSATFSHHDDKQETGTKTMYFDVQGTLADVNIYVQLIENRP